MKKDEIMNLATGKSPLLELIEDWTGDIPDWIDEPLFPSDSDLKDGDGNTIKLTIIGKYYGKKLYIER